MSYRPTRYSLLLVVTMAVILLAVMAVVRQGAGEIRSSKPQVKAGDTHRQLNELKEAIRKQEGKVDEQREALASSWRAKFDAVPEERKELEHRTFKLEVSIEYMNQHQGSELFFYVAHNLKKESPTVAQLHPKYKHLKRILIGMELNDVPENDSKFATTEEQVQSLEETMTEEITTLRKALRTELEDARETLKNMARTPKEQALAKDCKDTMEAFGMEMERLQELKLEQISLLQSTQDGTNPESSARK